MLFNKFIVATAKKVYYKCFNYIKWYFTPYGEYII